MQWLWRILTNFLRKLHQNTAAAPIKKAKRADTAFFQTQKKSRAFRKARRTSPRARPKAFSLEPRLLYHSRRGLGIVSAYSVDSVAQNAKCGRERRRFCTRTAILRPAVPPAAPVTIPLPRKTPKRACGLYPRKTPKRACGLYPRKTPKRARGYAAGAPLG